MNHVIVIAAIALLVLLFLKVPVYISVLAASVIYFIGSPNVNSMVFAQQVLAGSQGLSLLAIPFFVMAGVFMNYTGVTRRIMECCNVLTSRWYGGLAQVNVLLSTLMGGLSGSSLADAAMECKMLVPSMEAEGYSKPFSTVITAASGMIVPLIPPGTGLIIYACICNISVGKLFVAGIGPGIVLSVTLMIFTRFVSKKRGYMPHRTTKIPVSEKWAAIKPAILPLLLPIIIIGGVRIGVFTATEAGTVAIVYALILGILYHEMKVSDFVKGCKETVTTTSSIMLIVAAASCFSWILTKEQIPQTLASWMTSAISNKFIFLLICNVFLIVVGMFIEGNASMIVLAPLLHPVAVAFGIDPVHFAMVYIFNCTIGAFTPPMGTLMFVTCGVTGCRTKDFIKEAKPFYLLFLIDMLVLTYFPPLTTFLVDLIY
ncbi:MULTISPECIES: TRAP transporter large permease [Eubacteriales]|jgi:tripartite ATP-independent transporter DctM subunit|uniref:TRAP transporter large permease n=1 Tax=Eubacteriales TaxID=186802 RepID=UPI0001CE5DB7|nr:MULTISPECIES: TRAP transporter large permease [Eubacteriales]MBS5373098.1 TRAP transporter large permease [butyrate-producing bacterium]RGE04749.1 TRAP transporter large permease [Clostridium sp. AM34-11AC]RGE16990.1 TRAP transporter large permease [Desulfotomaculum sp. OF05-3]CBL40262.1 TRAP transporter, DctM subunit [butyrate-producing bacterium SS3/4]